MEISTSDKSRLSPWWPFDLASLPEKLKNKAIRLLKKLKKIGEDDPRRIFHSLKVGLALTLVSLFCYINPLFNGLGGNAIWAVLTVVLVMEYTVGGTLGKGLNRVFATFLGGSLALGAHHLAALVGDKGEPILLGLFVFLLAASATFLRFVPEIKARYDYAVNIVILTFSMVAVSSYRVDELVQYAQQRLSTITIGVAICLITSIFVFPVWAGEDLHKLTACNLEKLASFLEGMGSEYFDENVGSENVENKPFLRAYKGVLDSKTRADSLANFAGWEPGHGKFSFRHPWEQYLKIGALSRQCAYSIEALATHITSADKSQMATDPEFSKKIRSACAEMSSESAKALSDLAASIRSMTSPTAASIHVADAFAAASKMKAVVPIGSAALSDAVQSATTASLLAQVVKSTHQIAGAVEELARAARFKKPEPEAENTEPVDDGETPPHAAIDIDEQNIEKMNNQLSHNLIEEEVVFVKLSL